MGVAGLSDSRVQQGLLFDEGARQHQSVLDDTTDQIRERFGESVLRRAVLLPPLTKKRAATREPDHRES
jgi:hypothetical protein